MLITSVVTSMDVESREWESKNRECQMWNKNKFKASIVPQADYNKKQLELLKMAEHT